MSFVFYWGGPIGKRFSALAGGEGSTDPTLIEGLRSSAQFAAGGKARPLNKSSGVLYWSAAAAPSLATATIGLPSRLDQVDGDTRIAMISARLRQEVSLAYNAPKATATIAAGGKDISSIELPDLSLFKTDLGVVRTAIAKSEQHHTHEGAAQVLHSIGFLLAAFGVGLRQRPFTIEALDIGVNVLGSLVQSMKHHFGTDRPFILSDVVTPGVPVVPFLPVPAHSSFPGGHAAYAYFCVELLCAIAQMKAGRRAAAMLMADLIADNRVVAGLHFPLDGAAGEVLGVGLAYWLIATGSRLHATVPWSSTDFLLNVGGKMEMQRTAGNLGTVDVPAWRWLVDKAAQEW